MIEFASRVLDFFGYVSAGISGALRLDPRVFEVVQNHPESRWVVLTIAILGGASLLLGQSVILFVNRVRPARFVLTLLLNGVVFTISLALWAGAIWLLGRWLLPDDPRLGTVLRLVALGAAPYTWGFLVLIPYAGAFIGRVLSVWSFLVVLAVVAFEYSAGFWPSLAVVGLGWLLVTLLAATVGRPFGSLRQRLKRLIAGSDLDARVQDILLEYMEQPEASQSKGKPV